MEEEAELAGRDGKAPRSLTGTVEQVMSAAGIRGSPGEYLESSGPSAVIQL
jgi:hypothetical protein